MAGIGTAHRQSRFGRGRWRLDTALCGAAALLAPGIAHAASIAPASGFQLTAPVVVAAHPLLDKVQAQTPVLAPVALSLPHLPQAFPNHAAAVRADVLPHDLTWIPAPPAFHAAHAAAGGSDVYVNDGDITMTGNNMPGIVVTSSGNATVTAGTVITQGANSDGIDVNAAGDATINVDGVATYGNGSRGIYALAGGDISINAGEIYSTGVGSRGIYARSYGGDVKIDAGTVIAVSPSATNAIYAYGHNVDIHAGDVVATEQSAFRTVGIIATGVGAGADVNVTLDNSLYSHGARAEGILVTSDGTAEVTNNGAIDVEEYPGQKANSAGIDVNAVGDVTINNNGSIYSGVKGILARSTTGDINIHSTGDITAYQSGIDASTISTQLVGYYRYGNYYLGTQNVIGGDVNIDATNVSVDGTIGDAISAAGRAVTISVDGDVVTTAPGRGIRARGYAGDVTIHNNGSVSGTLAGIDAAGYGNVTIDGTGSVSGQTIGIAAQSIGGSITISQGNIVGSVDAEADVPLGGGLGDASHAIAIDVGNVTSNASGYSAIVAENNNYGGGVTIKAGDVKTYGDSAVGIVGASFYGETDITANSIETKGLNGAGIIALGAADTHIDVGSIETLNNGAAGIRVTGPYAPPKGSITVNAGSIDTAGQSSAGVIVQGNADVTLTAGSITTAGDNSLGIATQVFGSDNAIKIDAGTVATAGERAAGIIALGAGGQSGAIDVTAGSVTTSGYNAVGIVSVGYNTSLTTKADTVTTSGASSDGVALYSRGGTAEADLGSVGTTGEKSSAIYAQGTEATVNANSVTTTGDYSAGIILRAGAYGADGAGQVTVGSVSTAGKNTSAIDVDVAGDADHATDVSIDAGTITTTGQNGTGISVLDAYGNVGIKTGTLTTTGQGSTGIIVFGGRDIGIQAGSISTAAANAVYAYGAGSGALTIGIDGKVASSGDTALRLKNAGGTTSVTVAKGGSVSGAGDAISVQSGGGAVAIANAGTITGGEGYAIDVSLLQPVLAGADVEGFRLQPAVVAADVTDPAVTIDNTGTIVGGVKLAGGDDVLTNGGTFIATRDSDFGAGNDLFTNTGTLGFASASQPLAIHFLGLETFANGGLVDLRNGVAGDTLTLTGNYVGSGDARLGLDIGANGVSDKLIVAGAATGSTAILLNGTAADATLLAKPVTLVQAGAGTSAGAFTLADSNVGFISYGLTFDATNNSFALSTGAGASVYRLARIGQAAQAIWNKAADTWDAHMTDLRDGGSAGRGIWGQITSSVDTRHDRQAGNDVGYRQDYYGVQLGADVAGHRSDDGNGAVFGVTGGYVSSHARFLAGAERVHFDTVNLGGYAGVRTGVMFANLLGQYQHYRIDASDAAQQWSSTFNGDGYGAELEIGARLGGARFFAEPIASLAWQRTDLGSLKALGQELDFNNGTGLTGKIGARLSGTTDLKGGARAVFYAQANYVHAFKGDGGLLFQSGGTSEAITAGRPGDYGQGAIGVNIQTRGRLSGFIEADGDAGQGVKGGGGRVGLRLSF